ncbi:hypothetical protein RB24_24975 [Herbaspirillum rubrisubalbicans]|uniref:Uncharacterized protein n=1 Tax=Herbaspirillum rubrisubalbicans TaxID=80842 RepID=A0ABX9BUM3_9BURK|nr:hypothetical protein RB24_24975 [Herbaspirillum rubrisubalbicans]
MIFTWMEISLTWLYIANYFDSAVVYRLPLRWVKISYACTSNWDIHSVRKIRIKIAKNLHEMLEVNSIQIYDTNSDIFQRLPAHFSILKNDLG